MTAQFDHCGLPTCAEVREADGRCYCSCPACTTCTCGCAARSGFDRQGVGVYKGRGAGYTLLQGADRWAALRPNGEPVRGAIPRTLDEANKQATLDAREAGHVHA